MERSDLCRVIALAALAVSCGCTAKTDTSRVEFQMGERANIGPLTYNVIDTAWRSQLGTDFKQRLPEQRFLLLTISVTNGGGKTISVPLFTLEDQKGNIYRESDSGDGVSNWFGLLREINPAQTQQGQLLFDVPLGSYKLRVTDGGDPGTEKTATVDIPLRMDTDTGVDAPAPSGPPGAIK